MYVSAEEGPVLHPEPQPQPQASEQAQPGAEASGCESAVAELFAGASVLVTGGTGFLGKVLLEKLLRACPRLRTVYLLVRTKKGRAPQQRLEQLFTEQVRPHFLGKVLLEKLLRACPRLRTVYLLVRTKKGRAPQQRLEQLFTEQVFSQLRPAQLKKVVAVSGDAAMPGLGLSEEDRRELCRHVSVVFHVAATVRFDEQLRLAAAINLRGTLDVLRLARDMPNLKAVVHVSTAYSQCRERVVEERVYEAPIAPAQLLDVAALSDAADADTDAGDSADADADAANNAAIDAATDAARRCDADVSAGVLPCGYPNTYTLTKAAAEQLVRDEGVGLPVAIVRPSMVVATSQEPVSGWIDNVYGPTGVCVAATVGLLHVMKCDKRATANIVPCDLVVNACIAAAWDVATNRSPHSKEPKVFNLVSSDAPLRWEQFMALYQRFGTQVPPMRAIWYYSLCLTTSAPLLGFYKYFVHMVPALLADVVLILTTGKPKMVGTYRKIHRFLDMTGYFSMRDWRFENRRARELWGRLSPADRRLFPFDMRGFDWESYFYRYVRGVRLHILKEEPGNIDEALRRWNRLKRVDWGVRAAVSALLLWLLWSLLSALFQL